MLDHHKGSIGVRATILHLRHLFQVVLASLADSKARFPLDRNAIVKLHDQNRFWFTGNVLVKI